MPPKKNEKNRKGKGGKKKGGEGPTPLRDIRAIARSLAKETKAPNPIPAGAKRDQFKDTKRMKRLRKLKILRTLAPKQTTQLRNDRTSYKEANSAYMRGDVAQESCRQCQQGNGTMENCVVVAGEFGGACTNCSYDTDGKKCSFRRKVESDSEEDDEDEDEDEGGLKGKPFWDGGKRDRDDDAAGGDDGDANALFVPQEVSAH